MSLRGEPFFKAVDSHQRQCPADCTPEALQAQIQRFLAKGGTVVVLPAGAHSGAIHSLTGAVKKSAAKVLGAKTYASAMARKPKDRSRIVIND